MSRWVSLAAKWLPSAPTAYLRKKRRQRRSSQGQLQLKGCSHKDFQQEVFVPAATAAFHHDAIFARMLLQ